LWRSLGVAGEWAPDPIRSPITIAIRDPGDPAIRRSGDPAIGDTLLNPQIDPHRPLVVLAIPDCSAARRVAEDRLLRSLDLGIE
jgi:hypothetical protein